MGFNLAFKGVNTVVLILSVLSIIMYLNWNHLALILNIHTCITLDMFIIPFIVIVDS